MDAADAAERKKQNFKDVAQRQRDKIRAMKDSEVDRADIPT
jgi:hypothetical protein